jgi:hypothetical protein
MENLLSQWLVDHTEELQQEYADEWVAVTESPAGPTVLLHGTDVTKIYVDACDNGAEVTLHFVGKRVDALHPSAA